MSFLPAAQREIGKRQPGDPVRMTLEYMVRHAVGRHNAVPLRDIVDHLNNQGLTVTETGFQQTILAESRSGDYYIGSGHRGYFLIDTIDDARVMKSFYEARIRKENQNLNNLHRQSTVIGWIL